jgi:hypothetical protein
MQVVATETEASDRADRLGWNRADEHSPAGGFPVLPCEFYRVAAGLSLLSGIIRAFLLPGHLPHSAIEGTRALFAGILSALVVAGIRPRASAVGLLIAFAWMGRNHGRQGMDDYMASATCFWLACLPVGHTLCPWRPTRVGKIAGPDSSAFSRRLFVLWIAGVCFFALLGDLAWGAWLPQQVTRLSMGLLLAFLFWPPRTAPRWVGALMFAALMFGLLLRIGPTPGVLLLTSASLVVWAPEIGGRAKAVETTRRANEGLLDAPGALAAAFLVLSALSLVPSTAPPIRKTAAILADAGLAPALTWPDLPP